MFFCVFFFQAEDGRRDLVRSRGLGDVYKRQGPILPPLPADLVRSRAGSHAAPAGGVLPHAAAGPVSYTHLTLPTSALV